MICCLIYHCLSISGKCINHLCSWFIHFNDWPPLVIYWATNHCERESISLVFSKLDFGFIGWGASYFTCIILTGVIFVLIVNLLFNSIILMQVDHFNHRNHLHLNHTFHYIMIIIIFIKQFNREFWGQS